MRSTGEEGTVASRMLQAFSSLSLSAGGTGTTDMFKSLMVYQNNTVRVAVVMMGRKKKAVDFTILCI